MELQLQICCNLCDKHPWRNCCWPKIIDASILMELLVSRSIAGTSPQEQYLCFHLDRNDLSPIIPGQTAIIQSMQTGLWCRIAPLDANSSAALSRWPSGTGKALTTSTTGALGMLCDQPSPAGAHGLTYAGSGLAFQGTSLVAMGRGQPLLLANTSDPSQRNLTLLVAPPQPGGEHTGLHCPGAWP
jgi:hypothetical protein